ncbi:MAG: S1C family serine protease [Akkermansiaceae bacterium]
MMDKLLKIVVGAGLMLTPCVYGAFPLNEKDAPKNQGDLLALQDALKEALPKAKAATVCLQVGKGSGSGVIVSEDGLVMTAAHVSTGVGKKLTVVMPDGTKLKAKSLGLRADVDAALVQITDEGPFPFVEINETGDTELGDWIFSLGHSGGFDEDRGAVVRLARLVRIANNTIQTDGTLIGGDSGGPLFDMDGRLVGIHSRVGPQLPVNMHVPIHVFIDSMEEMKASEFIGEGPFAKAPEIGKGFLGIGTEVDGEDLKISKVGKGSPAEKADLKEGDVIKSVNEKEMKTRENLKALLAELAPEDELEIVIVRDGEEKKITVALGKR